MMGEKTTPKYSPEVRASAVHAVPGHRGNYPSLCGTYRVDCPEDLLCPANLARVGAQARGRYQPASWCDVRRTRTHQALEREVKEICKANEILKLSSALFTQAGSDRRPRY